MEYDLTKWLQNAANEEYAGRVLHYVAAIEAENRQLRAALEAIADCRAGELATDARVIQMENIARATLETPKAPQGDE